MMASIQELINKYEKCLSELVISNVEIAASEFFKNALYRDVIKDLKQLEESQKPVVPKYVALFIEKLKTTNRRYGVELEKVYNSDEDGDLKSWLWFNENILTLFRALENGYEVEVPVWYVKIGKGYFSGFDETKVTYVIDDAPGALAQRIKYDSKEEAEMDALQIGGEVVPG